MVTNSRNLVMIQGAVTKIVWKKKKKKSWKAIPHDLVTTLRWLLQPETAQNTVIVARSLLIPIDSGASLQWGDPTKMAATRDYVLARYEASTYIMSMASPNTRPKSWVNEHTGRSKTGLRVNNVHHAFSRTLPSCLLCVWCRKKW